jgi:TonB family protein
MTFSRLTLLACALCLVATALAQSQPWSPPPMLKAPCPDSVDSKTAWFDSNLYLLHQEGVTIPRALSTYNPGYTEAARRANIQGTVLLAVAISSAGTVDAVKVVCSLDPGLDANAVAAARKWSFAPATKDGQPVPVQIEVAMSFRTY